MAFSGWPEEALEFFDGLAAENTKAYWTAHKPVYEKYVLRPMAELVEDLAPEFGPGKIFRPYRDVRFSKDKSPYQTHIAAAAGGGYIRLSADGLAAGAGMYDMRPGQLDAYRRAVAADRPGRDLERVIAEIGLARYRRLRAQRAQDRSPWVSGGSPADRAAALQEHHRLAAVAGGAVAGDPGRPRPDRRVPAGHPAAGGLALRECGRGGMRAGVIPVTAN